MERINLSKTGWKDEHLLIELLVNELEVGHIEVRKCTLDTDYLELLQTDSYLYVSEVYVDKRWRRKGIANKLMCQLDRICKKKYPGFNNIVLMPYPMEPGMNITTLKEFYKKYGFKDAKVEVHYTNHSQYKNIMFKQLN